MPEIAVFGGSLRSDPGRAAAILREVHAGSMSLLASPVTRAEFETWADIKEDRTGLPGQDANWVSDRTFPAGSVNQAILSPPGGVQTPFSSWSMPS